MSIFLRKRSLSNAKWFCVKKRKFRKGNLHLIKIDLIETIFAVWRIITIMSNMCEKEFLELLENIEFSNKCPKFHIFTKNGKFSRILGIFRPTILIPYKFHGSSIRGILFFNFASCELLSQTLNKSRLSGDRKYLENIVNAHVFTGQTGYLSSLGHPVSIVSLIYCKVVTHIYGLCLIWNKMFFLTVIIRDKIKSDIQVMNAYFR